MFKILTAIGFISLSLSSQAMASSQNLYCASNDISATLFLHASKGQYIFKSAKGNSKISDAYNSLSSQVADNSQYSIILLADNQVLVTMKSAGIEFVLYCK